MNHDVGRRASPNPRRPARISAKLARRIAIAASGLREPRVEPVTPRHLGRVLSRIGLIQIDSVNVLARAHYVPLFSRLGAYDPTLLDRAAYGRDRGLFEYWAHEASLVRLDLQPHLRWRMAEARAGQGIYDNLKLFAQEKRPFIDAVLRRIEANGPMAAGELMADTPDERGRSGGWWGWSDGKRALEWLFWAGFVTTRTRRGFTRVYDLTERVLPRAILDIPTPTPAEAHRALIRVAIRALGVATEPDLRDYFRLSPAASRAAVAELLETGDLLAVDVEGWALPAYADPACARPRGIDGRTLLSPFDPFVWARDRTERIFGFRYRIEIYTPAHKRSFGYYSLPFLMGEHIVARVDLKADRQAGRLLVQSLHLEPGHDPGRVREALDGELAELCRWLGLRDIRHRADHPPMDG